MTTTETDTERGSRRKIVWHDVEITERQKQIMDLTEKYRDESNSAQTIATELGITPNAVYIARKRVRDIMKEAGQDPGNGASPFTPRRTLSLGEFQAEQDALDAETEVREISRTIQAKVAHLSQAQAYHEKELEKINQAQEKLQKMLEHALKQD